MKFTRHGFFKSIFGGFVAAAVTPSLVKAEEKSQPAKILYVDRIVFQVGQRQLQMAGDKNGDFKISWLDVKENESNTTIVISKPTTDTFKAQFKNDIR